MAEEQCDHEDRRDHEPQRHRAFAQPYPCGQRPQRQPDRGHVIHRADQEDLIVEQRRGDQRQHRPAAKQLTIERECSRQDQRETCDGVDLSGNVDVRNPLDERHNQIHHQVGNDLPLDLVEPGQVGIRGHRRNDVHSRQMIDVIGQRRQWVESDRQAADRRDDDEQCRDLKRCGAGPMRGAFPCAWRICRAHATEYCWRRTRFAPPAGD